MHLEKKFINTKRYSKLVLSILLGVFEFLIHLEIFSVFYTPNCSSVKGYDKTMRLI